MGISVAPRQVDVQTGGLPFLLVFPAVVHQVGYAQPQLPGVKWLGEVFVNSRLPLLPCVPG